MKALVLAAGLGTRLRPLTESVPKALVTVNGKTILERVLIKLKSQGFDDVILNVHHHADQIINFIENNHHFGMRIAFSEERDLLLDTGGGIQQAGWFFNDGKPFLVHNVDILSDIDLGSVYRKHLEENPLATLVIQERDTDRLLLFDERWELTGWKNAKTGTVKNPGKKNIRHIKSFCGIHVIDPALLGKINRTGVFSIIDVYLDLLPGNCMKGFEVQPESYWTDIGNPENLSSVDKYFRENKW